MLLIFGRVPLLTIRELSRDEFFCFGCGLFVCFFGFGDASR
jgi:hypothetical protein